MSTTPFLAERAAKAVCVLDVREQILLGIPAGAVQVLVVLTSTFVAMRFRNMRSTSAVSFGRRIPYSLMADLVNMAPLVYIGICGVGPSVKRMKTLVTDC